MPTTAPILAPAAAPRNLSWWMLLLIALAAVAVYLNTLQNEFTFDDVAIVQNSAHVLNLDWSEIWSDNYWPTKDGVTPDVLYRPLTLWTYLANQSITPSSAFWFHATNITLHGLCTVMVVLLAWRLFASRAAALLAGFLFAIHPIHTEAVANVVGRAEELAAIWSFAALLIYLPPQPLTTNLPTPTRPWWHGLLVASCFFAALLCKETPVALVGVFFLIDLWRWTAWPRDSRPTLLRWFARQTLRYYLPLAAALGIYLLMRIHATGLMRDIRAVHPVVNPLVSATLLERIVTPFAILAKYLSLLVWPKVLCADYSAPSFMPTANLFAPLPLTGALVVAGGVLLMLRYWRRWGAFGLTLAMFACSYALVANILRIGTILGERLFYLPSAFLLILIAWGAVQLWQWPRLRDMRLCRSTLAALGIIAVCALSARTYVRNQDWHDNVTLAFATAHDNTESAKACAWAGMVLTTDGPQPWMKDFGAELLKRSIDLYPSFNDGYWRLAQYYGLHQNLSESTIYLAESALRNPGGNDVRFALGAVLGDLKRHPTSSYLPGLEGYLHEHPTSPAARLAMALALRAQGNFPAAEKMCLSALQLDNTFHEADAELAMIRLDMGKTDLGINTLRLYVIHINRSLDARCTMAKALMDLDPKAYPTAIAEAQMNLDRANDLSPGTPAVRTLQARLNKLRSDSKKKPAPAIALVPPHAEDAP